jgi:hypothetical protein
VKRLPPGLDLLFAISRYLRIAGGRAGLRHTVGSYEWARIMAAELGYDGHR